MKNQNIGEKKMLLNLAKTEYMSEAQRSDEFKRFIKERMISSQTAFDLGIGYATKDDTISELLRNKKDLSPIAKDLGLIRIKDGKISDIFTDRIMYSLNDLNGNCIGFSGLSLKSLPKYLCTTMKFEDHPEFIYGIDGAEFIKKKGVVLVVEGFTDYLALYEKGLLNVVCTMGRMLSDEQLKALHKIASEIILGLDGDERGKKATMSIASRMIELGIKPYGIDYGRHKNVKDFMENENEAVKKMKEKMNSSELLL